MSEQKVQIFREKNLKAMESPESLHNYLRVISPGVWVVLCAVIAMLIGAVVWGIFGRIETTCAVAVISDDSGVTCVIPAKFMENSVEAGAIKIDGTEYKIRPQAGGFDSISESTDVMVRLAGEYGVGDVVFCAPVEAELDECVYAGTMLTERLNPISLLFK